MAVVAEMLEDELMEAIEKKDRKSVKHFVAIIVNNFEDKKEAEKRDSEIMLKLNEIEVTVKEGFKSMDKRFEDMQKYMDKRFEDMNKRFTMMFTFFSIGFALITLLIAIFKFIH